MSATRGRTDWRAQRVIISLVLAQLSPKLHDRRHRRLHHDPETPRKTHDTRLSSISELSPSRPSATRFLTFMQPEPPQASQNTLSPQLALEHPATTSQHGPQDHDQKLFPLSHHYGESGEPVSAGAVDERASRGSSRDRDPDAATRLSPASPLPRNRITEYENALVQTPKKRPHGPAFEVIKSTRKPDDKSCPIAKLPNGESTRRAADVITRYLTPEQKS